MTNRFNYDIYHDIIDCLVGTIEAKDSYTIGHSERVADMAEDLGEKMGFTDEKLERLHMAAHLHDIGKIGVPDNILNKNGKLNEDEWSLIKQHPTTGYNILIRSKALREISKIVLSHHERWDGEGYPSKIGGSDIPLESRIIAVCDTIDAMTSRRPYREPISWEICREEVLKNKGKQFDPEVVGKLNDLWSYWEKKYI